MEAARNAWAKNSDLIINVVYILVAVYVIWFVWKSLTVGAELEAIAIPNEVDANKALAVMIPNSNPDLRVKYGGEYTISWWMYITSWDYRSGLPKSVLQIVDSSLSNSSLFTSILYPNEAKMMIRVHTDGNSGADTDYNLNRNFENLLSGQGGVQMFAPTIQSPMCDLQDIDLQRYINVTVTVNGRIVDVYYDGKLNRSCVLPNIPAAPDKGVQSIVVGQKGGFGGKISNVQFFARPLTPDRIYAIYQAGPGSGAGVLGYISSKLGIKLTYSANPKA